MNGAVIFSAGRPAASSRRLGKKPKEKKKKKKKKKVSQPRPLVNKNDLFVNVDDVGRRFFFVFLIPVSTSPIRNLTIAVALVLTDLDPDWSTRRRRSQSARRTRPAAPDGNALGRSFFFDRDTKRIFWLVNGADRLISAAWERTVIDHFPEIC